MDRGIVHSLDGRDRTLTTSEEHEEGASDLESGPERSYEWRHILATLSVAAAIREQTEANKVNAVELARAIRGNSSADHNR